MQVYFDGTFAQAEPMSDGFIRKASAGQIRDLLLPDR